MRTIATLLLTVLCSTLVWAGDQFTDDQLKQISDAASALQANKSGAVTISINGKNVAVGLYKNPNGSITVAGDAVPAGLRGSYTFSGDRSTLNVAFTPSGGSAQPNRQVSLLVANSKLGQYVVQGDAPGTTTVVKGVVVYVGTTAYVLEDRTGRLLKAVGSILPGPIGNFFTNVGDGAVSAFATNIANTFHVGPYLAP